MDISSKSTRYINIHFYFIKDHIIRKDINVKQSSTYDMFADFSRNTLQGRKIKNSKSNGLV